MGLVMIKKDSNWFVSWGWIVLIVVIALIVIGVIISIFLKKKNQRVEKEESEKLNLEFLSIFGGKDNIISCEAKGSRLVLVLKDYSKLDEEKLKINGVTSLIKATNKVTLIVGEKSKELEEFISSINS